LRGGDASERASPQARVTPPVAAATTAGASAVMLLDARRPGSYWREPGAAPGSRRLRFAALAAGELLEASGESRYGTGAARRDSGDDGTAGDVRLHRCCYGLTVRLATGARRIGTCGSCPRKRTTEHEDRRNLPHAYLPLWTLGRPDDTQPLEPFAAERLQPD
jgi:hypothetical protein